MKLSKQIENLAKVTALKRHFSPGIESAFCTSLDDPGFLDRLVISLNSGSDDTFSDVSGFLGDEVRTPLLTDGLALADSLEQSRDEYINFFRAGLKSVFAGIDPDAIKAAIGNVSEHAANESSYFLDGDGSEQDNSADISKAIDRVGDLLGMADCACDDQLLDVPESALAATVAPFGKKDRNIVLAALRYYQQQGMGDQANQSNEIRDIATDGNEDILMDDAGIDDLCERINFAQEPRVLVVVEGGVASYNCDAGVDVAIFDRDNFEAGDADLRVPAHFADLSAAYDIPVEGQGDDAGVVANASKVK